MITFAASRNLHSKSQRAIMRDPDNTDNKYPKGMFVYAKVNPELKLVIDAYKSRIYYCAVAGSPEIKHLAYFERELMDPREAK
jgi:hypothetical protein